MDKYDRWAFLKFCALSIFETNNIANIKNSVALLAGAVILRL